MDLSTSALPDGDWELIWNDEFEGDTLDESKWQYRRHRFGGPVPQWTPEAVRLNGEGQLELTAFERDGEYFCGALQTGSNFLDRPGQPTFFANDYIWPIGEMQPPTFEHTYGYWEIRCILPNEPGWWGAFWLQSSIIGASLDYERTGVEIDVMENFKRTGEISHNVHWGGYADGHKTASSGDIQVENWQGEFHNYGLLWTPTALTFFIDGIQSWATSEAVPQCPQFLLVTTEIQGATGGMQTGTAIRDATLPDVFVVDHVRVFDPA